MIYWKQIIMRGRRFALLSISTTWLTLSFLIVQLTKTVREPKNCKIFETNHADSAKCSPPITKNQCCRKESKMKKKKQNLSCKNCTTVSNYTLESRNMEIFQNNLRTKYFFTFLNKFSKNAKLRKNKWQTYSKINFPKIYVKWRPTWSFTTNTSFW